MAAGKPIWGMTSISLEDLNAVKELCQAAVTERKELEDNRRRTTWKVRARRFQRVSHYLVNATAADERMRAVQCSIGVCSFSGRRVGFAP
jgi:hypothetical protein